MSTIAERGYAHPDRLVSTEWVAEHLDDPAVRLLESNEDALLYASGHIPGALEVDWTRDLNDPLRRDYLDADGFAALASRLGITPETTLVFYGDKSNWWACYALWVFAALRPRSRQDHGRRTPEVAAGGAPAGARGRRGRALALPAPRARRREDPRLPRAGARAPRAARAADRRAQPPGVHRRAPAHARLPERGRAARRPRPRRGERAVGARRRRAGRHLQERSPSCARSTSRRPGSLRIATSSSTAASASAAATPGSC